MRTSIINIHGLAIAVLLQCIAVIPFTGIVNAQAFVHSRKDGNWTSPSTWQGGNVPGPTDNVRIQHDVTLSQSVEVADVKMIQPGTLTGTGSTPITLKVNGDFNIKNGFNHNNLINVYLSGAGTNLPIDNADFYGLTVAGSYQLQSGTIVRGMLDVRSGATVTDVAPFTIDLLKADTAMKNNGTVNLMSTVRYAANTNQYVAGATYANLQLIGSGTKTAIGTINAGTQLYVQPGVVFNGGSQTINLTGTGTAFNLGGTFQYGTSTVNYSATGDQQIARTDYYNLGAYGGGIKYTGGSMFIYGDLAFGARIEAASDTLHIQGSYLSNGDGYFTGTAFAIRFFGSGTSLMRTTAQSQQDATHLIIAKSSIADTVRVLAAISGNDAAVKTSANGNLDIYSGVFDLSTAYIQRVSGTTQTGVFRFSDGAALRTAGTESLPYFLYSGGNGRAYYASHTVGALSNWYLYGGAQSVRGASQGISQYGNLIYQGSGSKTQTGAVTIATSLTRTSPTIASSGGNVLTYMPGATLRYLLSDSAGSGFQTTQITASDEFPVVNGPTNVTIENSLDVTLHAFRTVSGTFRFVEGNMILDANNLTIGTVGSITGAGPPSHFVTNSTGALVKQDLGSSAFQFPIGPDASSYNPVTIVNSGMVDTYSARVQSWLTYMPYDPTRIVTRQWTLDEASPGGSVLGASFQWSASEQGGMFSPASSVYVMRSLFGGWGEYFTASVSGSNPATASVSGITSLSDFHVSNDAYLPVELDSFSLSVEANSANLLWTTASELNNRGFAVLRSWNNIDWEEIAFVEGRGTTTIPQEYNYTDDLSNQRIISPVCYYKLRQMDIQGGWKDSESLTAVFGKHENIGTAYVYPAPCNNVAWLTYSIAKPDVLRVELYSASGELLQTIFDGFTGRTGTYSIRLDCSNLPDGLYFCRIVSGSDTRIAKFQVFR